MSEEVDSEVYPSEDGTLSINLPSFFPSILVHVYFGLSVISCLVRFLLFFFLKLFCSVFFLRSRLGISRERHKPSVVWQWVLFIFCLFNDVYFLFTNFSKPFLIKKITFVYFLMVWFIVNRIRDTGSNCSVWLYSPVTARAELQKRWCTLAVQPGVEWLVEGHKGRTWGPRSRQVHHATNEVCFQIIFINAKILEETNLNVYYVWLGMRIANDSKWGRCRRRAAAAQKIQL